jgi:hypothetical protein
LLAGLTALSAAARIGAKKMVKLLIEVVAAVAHATESQTTAQHAALQIAQPLQRRRRATTEGKPMPGVSMRHAP